MKLQIICNKPGSGKTWYALNTYVPNIYYSLHHDILTYNLNGSDKICDIPYCIIDSADKISEHLFHSIINDAIVKQYEVLVVIFEITTEELANCSNFNSLWECGLIDREYQFENYTASEKVMQNFLASNYPDLNQAEYLSILKLAEYNFNNIDRIMLLNRLHSSQNSEISQVALTKYVEEVMTKKFADIPDADILLKESSLIGIKFDCEPLQSSNGFGCEYASSYLKKMDEMHGFIRSCVCSLGEYEFVSDRVYQVFFDSIPSEKKNGWINILIKYYLKQYELCYNSKERCEILCKLRRVCMLSPIMKQQQKDYTCQLWYEYRKQNNMYMAIEMAKELTQNLREYISIGLYEYIQNFLVETYMCLGKFRNAYSEIQQIEKCDSYSGSKMFLKYHSAMCCYSSGDVDLAYKVMSEVVDYLKKTSLHISYFQELCCVSYSFMATIQNHLKLEDDGYRYYSLALKHVKNIVGTDEYYYDILKKCDMFFEYPQVKKNLDYCLAFFEGHKKWRKAGEVSLNLATEILFQEGESKYNVKRLLFNAQKYLSDSGYEKLAYVKNNIGVYYVLAENNIPQALQYFKEALFIGLSDFSYMTIYLNICMCYILLGQIDCDEFENAEILFEFAVKKLKKRKHETRYEVIYEQILKIIREEYMGNDVCDMCSNVEAQLEKDSFFLPLVLDIIKRNQHSYVSDSVYKDNSFFYSTMNKLHCFFAEFRFWE